MWIIIIISHVLIAEHVSHAEEYCIRESFSPTCGYGEMIVMDYAQFGRMKIGRCVSEDLGFLGCSADVLPQFHEDCSGQNTCDIKVFDISTSQGCRQGLEKYLDASYSCKPALLLDDFCSSSNNHEHKLTSENVYLSNYALEHSCLALNKKWKISADAGQTLNISLITLNPSNNLDAVYGLIDDPVSGQKAIFGNGPPNKHLIETSSNTAEITFQKWDQGTFLIYISVIGCALMEPSEGTWMTRTGDTLEIGCHSSAKSWTMKCENNQWIGAVGQCGKVIETQIPIKGNMNEVAEDEKQNLSLNAMIFAACSLLILISSIIFLIGTCLLKKKDNLPPQMQYVHADTIAHHQDRFFDHSKDQGTLMDPSYKSMRLTADTVDNGPTECVHDPPSYANYMNNGETSGSVKYFVLEDKIM